MAFFIRKFERAKWSSSIDSYRESQDKNDIEGDTFSKCLFTSHNTFSVWYSDTDDWDKLDIILATIFSSGNGPSRSDIMILDENELSDITVTDEVGDAPVTDEINKLHRNLSYINYRSMGLVADKMASIICKDEGPELKKKRCKRFSEKNVEKLVKKVANDGHIDLEKACMNERWAKRLRA